MAHDHHHDHHHHDAPEIGSRAFAIGIVLNTLFVVVEASAGLWSGSLALLADAGHNLSDVAALGIAWGAAYLGQRPPSARRTYGLSRLTVLAAFANAVLLLIAVGAIAIEAFQELSAGSGSVRGGTVMAVAGLGILVNGATTLLFVRDRHRDLNIEAAFQHMAADTAVSLGVVISGAIILLTGKMWIDPLVSLGVAALIAWGSWRLLRASMNLAVDGVPDAVDHAAVRAFLTGAPGVSEIHDLHIWPLSTTKVALTVHLVRPGAALDDAFLGSLTHDLEHRFGISHATIQIEAGGSHACPLKPDHIV